MPLINWITKLAAKTDTKIKGDEIFIRVCPFCGNEKWNLQININKQVWHCWACDRGKGESLINLLHYYGIKYSGKRKYNLITDNKIVQKEANEIQRQLNLIAKPLKGSTTLAAKAVRKYLLSRGIHDFSDIWYHPYFAVVPLYQQGKLVYYVERQIFGHLYRNPKVSKTNFLATMGDNIVGVLCEGVFDAITIKQLGYTAMPLLGKFMSEYQIKMLKKYNFKEVIICLDEDASNSAVELFATLQYHKFLVRLALLPEGEDPNSYRHYLKDVLENAVDKLTLKQKLWLTRSRNEDRQENLSEKIWFDSPDSDYDPKKQIQEGG